MKLPVMKKYFDGYTVPEKYQEIASCIIRRFNITGAADGTYICNCLAYDSGCGDGRGNFTGDDVNIEKCSSFLLHAYGCNILPEELPELQEILKTGELTPSIALPGIRSFIQRMRHEKPYESGGRYLKSYIKRSIHNLADAIDELTGSVPEGYTPDYYNPGYIFESDE